MYIDNVKVMSQVMVFGLGFDVMSSKYVTSYVYQCYVTLNITSMWMLYVNVGLLMSMLMVMVY